MGGGEQEAIFDLPLSLSSSSFVSSNFVKFPE